MWKASSISPLRLRAQSSKPTNRHLDLSSTGGLPLHAINRNELKTRKAELFPKTWKAQILNLCDREHKPQKPTIWHLDLGSTDGLPPSRNQSGDWVRVKAWVYFCRGKWKGWRPGLQLGLQSTMTNIVRRIVIHLPRVTKRERENFTHPFQDFSNSSLTLLIT